MTRYGIDLIKYGWYVSDCAPRRVALKVGKWTGITIAGLVLLLIFIGMLSPEEWKFG